MRVGTKGSDLRFGLLSETRQTIAPVTFFAGTERQFTIEVLGEWVLRGVADGAKGSLFYGPADKSPETPVLRIIDGHGKVMTQLTLQQFLGDKGLNVNIPGVAEIAIGEAPRAVDGAAASSPTQTGTMVLGAADGGYRRPRQGGLRGHRLARTRSSEGLDDPGEGLQPVGQRALHRPRAGHRGVRPGGGQRRGRG